ncbi:MAG: helix-turn-helix domain-containing protein [Planctomycetes bacterium]|nr:helix-turn-helix domain-containing protein [Planctomycetota bacterium]
MPYPHRYIKLTDDQRRQVKWKLQELLMAGKSRARTKLQAIWLSDRGDTFSGIARHSGRTYRTIQNWMRRYRAMGFDAFIKSL